MMMWKSSLTFRYDSRSFFYEDLALRVYLFLKHTELERRDPARGLAYRHCFKSFAHFVGVYDFLLRRRGEAGAPAGHDLHEPFAFEAAQGFAHRRAADVHLFRNRHLGQALAACERFFKNFPSELFVDEFRGRVPRSRRNRHRYHSHKSRALYYIKRTKAKSAPRAAFMPHARKGGNSGSLWLGA